MDNSEGHLSVLIRQIERDSLGQALLFLGEETTEKQLFINQILARIVCTCEEKKSACVDCQSSILFQNKQHPDIHYLKPEKKGGLVKVEQVRDLEDWLYQAPRLSAKRVIVIDPADKMNPAAANALLKILEEPPRFIQFFLIAEHASNVLPTILSRCQRWQRAWQKGDHPYSEEEKAQLADVLALIKRELDPLALAEKWSKVELSTLISFLYKLTSAWIKIQLGLESCPFWEQLQGLSAIKPLCLYHQLDKIKRIKRYLNQGIAVNQLVSLEAILVGYN